MRRLYNLCSREIELVTNWDAAVEWADLVLLPYVSIGSGRERTAILTFQYGGQYYMDRPKTCTRVRLHLGKYGDRYAISDSEFVIETSDGVVYRVADRRIDAFYPERTEDSLRDPARLCREILYNSLPEGSWFELHASAVARGKKCIVFAGPKGAGKTTLLCRLLSAGERESLFDFVSNDRVWLGAVSREVTCVLGSPAPIAIAYGTMASMPELARCFSLYRDVFNVLAERWSVKNHEFSPSEIAECFRCKISTNAEIVALIGLERGESNLLEPVEDKAMQSALLLQCVRDDHDSYPNWMQIGKSPSERSIGDLPINFPMYRMHFDPTTTTITGCHEAILGTLGNLLV